MPIRLSDLISRIPRDVEGKVRRTRDQTRAVVQEALRTECRLVMRTPEEAEDSRSGGQVPVEIEPGYPAALKGLMIPDDHELFMLLGRYRAILESASIGAAGLLKLRLEMVSIQQGELIGATETELSATQNCASELLSLIERHDPLKQLISVREDFLGVYKYEIPTDMFSDDYMVNRANIKLYWGVIGLVAEWMGCLVEDLTIVVLTHELAHAYTQLGADIEGRRWHARAFADADVNLKEGIAQYYTERVLSRMERRYGGALKVYRAMLPKQPEAYRTHVDWLTSYSPEAVRRAILEVRRWQEGTVAHFERRLKEAHTELRPESSRI